MVPLLVQRSVTDPSSGCFEQAKKMKIYMLLEETCLISIDTTATIHCNIRRPRKNTGPIPNEQRVRSTISSSTGESLIDREDTACESKTTQSIRNANATSQPLRSSTKLQPRPLSCQAVVFPSQAQLVQSRSSGSIGTLRLQRSRMTYFDNSHRS